jgi:predicted CoA-substrate-specific enzyme activase
MLVYNRYFAGVDVGASSTKVAIIDDRKRVKASSIRKSGVDFKAAADACFETTLRDAKLTHGQISYITATGYGRKNVVFADDTRTEIMCHGVGAHHYFPGHITVIDIGAQDTKIIKLDAEGNRIRFKMNRKCAAGTGAFLEEIAHRMDIPLDALDMLARRATKDITISSYCTVFASTEILARVREGETKEDMAKGIFASVVNRILEMESISGKVVMTGGVVAYNSVLVELVEARLGVKVYLPPNPQLIGAFGAALTAMR